MDEAEYRDYLKKIKKQTKEQIDEHVGRVQQYEQFMKDNYGKNADESTVEELMNYMKKLDEEEDDVFRKYFYSIYQYYRCTFNQYLSDELNKLYCTRTGQDRRIFKIKKFKGLEKSNIKKLNELGIINIEDVHEKTRTAKMREELASKTNLPIDWILKITKLSDLARIAGLKVTRSLLYYDAGVDTLEKIATWDPVKLREHFIKFYNSTNYQGAKPPTQKECNNHVKVAKSLPKIIEY